VAAMRLIKRLLVVLLVVALLAAGFALGQLNPQEVAFDLGFFRLPGIPLGFLACLILLVGFALGLLLSGLKVMGLRMRIGSLKRQLKRVGKARTQPQVSQQQAGQPGTALTSTG